MISQHDAYSNQRLVYIPNIRASDYVLQTDKDDLKLFDTPLNMRYFRDNLHTQLIDYVIQMIVIKRFILNELIYQF